MRPFFSRNVPERFFQHDRCDGDRRFLQKEAGRGIRCELVLLVLGTVNLNADNKRGEEQVTLEKNIEFATRAQTNLIARQSKEKNDFALLRFQRAQKFECPNVKKNHRKL